MHAKLWLFSLIKNVGKKFTFLSKINWIENKAKKCYIVIYVDKYVFYYKKGGRILKRRVIIKKAIAVAVTMSLMTCLVPNGSITVNAASKKSMLSKTKISVNVGKKKTVKLKKAKYKVVWKIISGKKNISIKKKGKYKQKIQIKGKKLVKQK